jgi:hypothetical protein
MHEHYQPRLRLALGGEERSLGPGVRVVRFEETTDRRAAGAGAGQLRPILGADGTIRGSVWVDASSGRIVRTEGRMAGVLRTSTTITTFVRDERLALTVPAEMRTTWTYTDNRGGVGGPVNGVARYGNFRRFDVKTDTSIDWPQRP